VTATTPDTLARRVAQLEQDNRRLKSLGFLLLLLLTGVGTLGVVTTQVPKEIEAQTFVVRDPAGHRRIVLGLVNTDDAYIVISDAHGRPGVVLGVAATAPVLRLSGPDGNGGIMLAAADTGHIGLSFHDIRNKKTISLGIAPDGSPHLQFFAADQSTFWKAP